MKHSADEKNVNKNERCVLCGTMTEYDCNTSVAERECFVVGCGQLCRKCYEEVSRNEAALISSKSKEDSNAW